MNNPRKGGYTNAPRSPNSSGNKSNYNPHHINSISDPQNQHYLSYVKRGDVSAYPGSGVNNARLPVAIPQSYAGGTHSSILVGPQQATHLRSNIPLSAHNTHSSSGVPPISHLSHSHTTLSTQHPGLTGAVSGPSSGIGLANPVAQLPSAIVPSVGNSSGSGTLHDVNTQGIQNSNLQLQQGSVSGVPLPGGMPSGHSMMYAGGSQVPQQQGQPPISQTAPYYSHSPSQSVPQIHLARQQPQTSMSHSQGNVTNFHYVPMSMMHQPPVYSVGPSLFQLNQQRPATSNGQSAFMPQLNPAQSQSFYPPFSSTVFPHTQPLKPAAAPPAPMPKEKKIIAIINPVSMKSIFADQNEETESEMVDSPQESRDSSASNTPAPREKASPNDVAAVFAMKVASVAADKTIDATDLSDDKRTIAIDEISDSQSKDSLNALSHTEMKSKIVEDGRELGSSVKDSVDLDSNKLQKVQHPVEQLPQPPPPTLPEKEERLQSDSSPVPLSSLPSEQDNGTLTTSEVTSDGKEEGKKTDPAVPQLPPTSSKLSEPKLSLEKQAQQQTQLSSSSLADKKSSSVPAEVQTKAVPAPTKQVPMQTNKQVSKQLVTNPTQSKPSKPITNVPPPRGGNAHSKQYSSQAASKNVQNSSQNRQLQYSSQNKPQYQNVQPTTTPPPQPITNVSQPKQPAASATNVNATKQTNTLNQGKGQTQNRNTNAPVAMPSNKGAKPRDYPQSDAVATNATAALAHQLEKPSSQSSKSTTVPQLPSKLTTTKVEYNPPKTTITSPPNELVEDTTDKSKVQSHETSVCLEAASELQKTDPKVTEISKLEEEEERSLSEEVVKRDSNIKQVDELNTMPPPNENVKADCQTSEPISSKESNESINKAPEAPETPLPDETTEEAKSDSVSNVIHSEAPSVNINKTADVENLIMTAPRRQIDNSEVASPLKTQEEPAVAAPPSEDEGKDKTEEAPEVSKDLKTDVPKEKGTKGHVKYDRTFLLNFQRSPYALQRPNLPNLEVVLDGPNTKSFDRPPKMNTDFTPNYLLTGRTGRQMPFIPSKPSGGRNSQSGKRPQKIIDIKLSSSSESHLKPTANAWKPGYKMKDHQGPAVVATADDVDSKIALIEKKVRGILNKLTPDNFDKLVSRVRELPLENATQFDRVISLVFEKAVSEQGFSTMYAQLCHVLAQMSTKVAESEGGKSKTDVKFKNCIIHKCQKEFEKDNKECDNILELKKQLDSCVDDKKVELAATIEYEETMLRKKAVGNIRFIGELYKLKMLTSPIMMRIIGSLLEKRDEESLECLCKLLSTIGKSLDTNARSSRNAQMEVNRHFALMQELVSCRSTSSRVRFLMMNVIDMRKNDWVPRREDAKPKTKAQVHEDIKKEELEAAHILNTPRRDDRERKKSRDNRVTTLSDGWMISNATAQRTSFDSQRIRNTVNKGAMGTDNVELRPGHLNWGGGGSSMGAKENDNRSSNRYSALEDDHPMDNRRSSPMSRFGGGNVPHRPGLGFASKSMPPPLEKSSFSNKTNSEKSSSRSSSRDSSMPRDLAPSPVIKAPSAAPPMDYDAANKLAVSILEEYISIDDKKEAKDCVVDQFSSNDLPVFVECAITWVLDKNSRSRKLVGQLLHHLISKGVMQNTHLTSGSKTCLVNIEEYIIDIPKVCKYFGEIYAPLLLDSVFTLKKFSELFLCSERKSDELLAGLVFAASTLMGSNKVSNLWNESGLQWTNLILNETSVEDFVSKHEIQFTVTTDGKATEVLPEMIAEVSPESIQRELLRLFNRGASPDEIFSWISDNVKDHSNKKFIRSLVTAFVESQAITSPDGSSISLSEDFEKKLVSKVKVLVKYVDNDDNLGLQCLFALQAISAKYEHPPGLLEKCFNVLYDQDVVPEDIFFEWEKNDDPEEQVGKGVCVTSVHKFLRWLREAEAEADVD